MRGEYEARVAAENDKKLREEEELRKANDKKRKEFEANAKGEQKLRKAKSKPTPKPKTKESTSTSAEPLSSMTVPELKAELRKRKLKVGGKKSELIARLKREE